MGQSKKKVAPRSVPPAPSSATVSLAKLSTTSPAITLDTGTPVSTDSFGDRNISSTSKRLHSRASTDSLTAGSVPEADEDVPSIDGPRPSIDDDNAEADSDLLSPNNTSTLAEQSGSEDEDEVADEIVPTPRTISRLPFARSNSTPLLIPTPHNAFAPPFYNRTPTPLPPSPSFTSLLRPSFSSRPTTPDGSESENAASVSTNAGEGTATEAAVAKSARDARTVPRASPEVPTYEYYGFVLYLTSGLCFLMYILWSYLPSPFLHQLGIYYYPNRWWSLAVPAFLVMTLVYIYVALAAYNTEYLTPPLGSVTNLVDDAASIAALQVRGANGKGGPGAGGKNGKRGKPTIKTTHAEFIIERDEHVNWREIWSHGTDGVMDVPIGGVCEVLYGDS